MAATDPGFLIDGYSDLLKALKDSDPELQKEFKAELRKIGESAKKGAELEATRKRLIGATRKLSTKYLVKPRAADIALTASATNKGFPYPAVYEYGGSQVRYTGAKTGYRNVVKRSVWAQTTASRVPDLWQTPPGYPKELGPLAFLAPGAAGKEPEVIREIEDVMERTMQKVRLT